MNNDVEFHKSYLNHIIECIRGEVRINFTSWRSIFDYGSSEWDYLSDSERSEVLNVIKSNYSFPEIRTHYESFNELMEQQERNANIDFSLSLI